VPSRTALENMSAVEQQRPGTATGVVQVDESPELAEQHGIQGLPTVIVFRGGRPVQRRVGLMSREDLARLLEQVS
jgi:thioredoxin 1